MEIVNIKVTKLAANTGQVAGLPTNPRQWTAKDVERLARSLDETPELFDARPCLVYPFGDRFVVLGGNMRLAAAKHNGAKEVPCIVFPADTPADKLREIVVKDNGAFGAWDFDALANEWDDLPLVDWGVPVWDGEGATAGGVEIGAADVQEDDFDEDGEIAVRCKRGDIWQLGEHRLMCGDSIELAEVQQLMGGGVADISFFSPPYNTGGIGKNLTKKDGRSKYINDGDDMAADDYTAFLDGAIKSAAQASQFTFMNLQYLANNKRSLWDVVALNIARLADVVVWDKGRSQPAAAANVLNSEYEFIFVFSDKGNRAIGTKPFHGTLKNIVHISPSHNDYAKLHNAVFPVALAAHFVENFAAESVLDLFGGTGTTLIAAEQLGRKAYLMEIDPHYCDVILQRGETFTGRKAEKIN